MTVPLRETLTGDRAKSALGVALFHALLGYALIVGLGVAVPTPPASTLKLFDVPLPRPQPPPRPPAPRAAKAKAREGASAPPNLKAKPTEIVAPEPRVRIEVPPLIAAAPIAGTALDPSAGAAPLPGPGTGAGGEGNGLGSGRGGNGTGGGGGGIAVRARQIAGDIREADYPRAIRKLGVGLSADVRFTIGTDGRASGCRVFRSSGNDRLDAITCRLIEERFRFSPARDKAGNPVPELSGWEQYWWGERRR